MLEPRCRVYTTLLGPLAQPKKQGRVPPTDVTRGDAVANTVKVTDGSPNGRPLDAGRTSYCSGLGCIVAIADSSTWHLSLALFGVCPVNKVPAVIGVGATARGVGLLAAAVSLGGVL